jgi:hypothetical protein
MGIEKTNDMDKVTLLKRTPNYVEFQLPHGWKKFGHKRQTSDHWDFYLFSSDNQKFRSYPEVERYLENNPNVKCDLSVTNTKWPSTLKKTNPESKKRKSDQTKANLANFKKSENDEVKLPLSAAFRKIHPWQNCAYCGDVFQKADRDLDLAAGYSKGPVRSLSEHQVWCLKQRRLMKEKEAIEKLRLKKMDLTSVHKGKK